MIVIPRRFAALAQALQTPHNRGMHTKKPAPPAKPRLPKLPAYLHLSDIQGLAQLATQATLGVAGLAENVQGNVYKAVASFFGPLGAKFIDAVPGRSGVRTLGITGLVCTCATKARRYHWKNQRWLRACPPPPASCWCWFTACA